MKTAAIIPARFASTRMPGKVLMDLCGHPMIWWVWKHTIQVKEFDEVYIAADDERVQRVCEKFGAKVIMTGTDCGCLIDRLFQVSKTVEADYYSSINGDEPLLEPEVMKAVLPDDVELDKPVVRGLAREFTNPAEVIDPANMKMVIGRGGYCLYRSRSPIPYPYTTTQFSYKKYVGVELFNKKALEFYVSTEPTELEKIEDIGALRFLEYGIPIHYDIVKSRSLSVDTPKDLAYIRGALIKEIEEGHSELRKNS